MIKFTSEFGFLRIDDYAKTDYRIHKDGIWLGGSLLVLQIENKENLMLASVEVRQLRLLVHYVDAKSSKPRGGACEGGNL